MTVTFTIPTSQTFAAGDCINIALGSNPFLSTGGGTYSPFYDTSACSISTSQTFRSCQLPASATSASGQSMQVLVNAASSVRLITTSFKFQNPYSQRTLTFQVSFMKGCSGSQLGLSSQTQAFTQSAIAAMNLDTSSSIIGDTNVVLTVKFKIGSSLRPNGRIVLTVPRLYDPQGGPVQPVIDNSVSTPQVTSSGTNSISVSDVSFISSSMSLSIDYSMTNVLSSGQEVTFLVTNFLNPINYSPLTGFSLATYDMQGTGNYALIDQSTSYSLTKSLVAQALAGGAVYIFQTGTQIEDYTLGQKNRDLGIAFEINLPLEQTCYVKIEFPPEIKVNVDENLSGVLVTITPGFLDGTTIISSTGNTVVLQGCPSLQTGYSNQIAFQLQRIVSPGQVKEVSDFVITVAKDSAFTQILAKGTKQENFMITRSKFTNGAITNMQFAVSSTSNGNNIVQEYSEYVATFQVSTNLFYDSQIVITLPSGLTGVSATPSCVLTALNSNTGLSCTASIGQINTITIGSPFNNNASPSGAWAFAPSTSSQQTISVQFNGATNPTSATNAGAWQVQTFNKVSTTFYLVDSGTNSISFSPSPGALTQQQAITVSNAITANKDSLYTFYITAEHDIPAFGIVQIQLPTEIIVSSSALIKSSCQYVISTTSSISQTCNVTATSGVTSIFITLSAGHSSSSTLKLSLKGLLNPRTKSETSSFIIKTLAKDSSTIDQSSGSSFTVTMQSVQNVQDLSVSASSTINGETNTYLVTFVSPIALINGDQVALTFDSNIKPVPVSGSSGSVSCSGTQQISSISCSLSSNVLTVQMNSVTSTAGTYAFKITKVQNAPSTKLYNVITAAVFSDSTNNQLMTLSGIYVMLQNTLPNKLTASLTQSSPSFNSSAIYTIVITPFNAISGTGSVTINWPMQLSLPSTGNPKCTVTTATVYTSNCNWNSVTRTIIISGVFNPGSTIPYKGTITVVLESLTNPADNRNVNSFMITTYDDPSQTFIIDQLPQNYLFPELACNFPCKSCPTLQKSQCQSCWSDLGKPYLMSNSSLSVCQQSCNTGYTTNGNTNLVCTTCDQSCAQCADNGLVGDASRCTVCATGYQYQYTPLQQCLANCNTQGYYEQDSKLKICGLCNSNCLACSKQASNCTSCNIKNPQYRYLFNFQCIETCPFGFTNVGAQCVKCDSTCSTCQNSTSTCTSCDTSSVNKYLFSYQCLKTCPEGTQANPQTVQCEGCLKGCSLCDSKNQTKCLQCKYPLLEFQGSCLQSCPSGYSVNFFGTACTNFWNFSFPTIPYPHLMACAAMILIAFISKLKDWKRALLLPNIMILCSPVEFVSQFSLAVFSILYQSYKFAYVAGIACFAYIILNLAAVFMFECRIARKDIEYMQWRAKYRVTSRLILVLSGLLSFKIIRLHYSVMFGYDRFKATFQFPGTFQRQIIIFTYLHIIFCSAVVIGIDVVGLLFQDWGTQLQITMVETAAISVGLMILDFIELCKLKHYLGDDQRIDYDALLNQMNETMDKKLRQDMLKQIMNHVRGNKDINLNNRFDELLGDMGPRRCQSMIDFGNELEEDPRKTKSLPGSPRNDFEFDKEGLPGIDNVYAESKPADPLGRLGKIFSDFDSQVQHKDFDKYVSRKGGDFFQFEKEDYQTSRKRKNKARGRKNQYYTQIDAEDDEEAENIGIEDDSKDQDDLDVIKEEEDEDDFKKQKKEKKKALALKEQEEREKQERLRKEQEQREQDRLRAEEVAKLEKAERERQERQILELQHKEIEQKRAVELEKKKIADFEAKRLREEDRKKKEEEDRIAKAAKQKAEEERKRLDEAEQKRLEDEIALQTLRAKQNESQNKPQTAGSINNQDVKMSGQGSLQAFYQVQDPIMQVPPDYHKRTFNECDILGEFDRDDKGNVIVLQNEMGHYIDKQGRDVNERGYLKDPSSGDIVENMNNRTMFKKDDIDERGEIPAPFCVDKFNFNPNMVRGDLDYDRAGRPVFSKGMLDKQGKAVNKKGWLVDGQGNICDIHGRKKFDKKQLTAEGDFPRLFNLNGRRFDINDLCGQLNRDAHGNLIFKKNKKGQKVDNTGKLVNERGYLIDEAGNIVDKEKKKMFEKRFLKNGEFPKIFPFTKFNIKRVLGDFEMDPLGNPILEKGSQGEFLDRNGKRVNKRGYFVDKEGNVIDKLGKRMFEVEILDSEGEIPKVFRTGLLKSDTGSSLSRLMSEIERNQPSEYGNPQWRRQQQKEELRKQQEARKEEERKLQDIDRLSGNTSVDSMMEDTPSNYNLANQRFDLTSEMLNAKSQQIQQARALPPPPIQPNNLVTEEDEYDSEQNFDGDFAQNDEQLMKKRRLRKKKKVVQVYNEPSDKDIMMAKAYGGIAKGAPKKVVPKTIYRDSSTPMDRNNKAHIHKLSGAVSGIHRADSPARIQGVQSLQQLEEFKPDVSNQRLLNQNESQEASLIAVPEHHLREQRLKQRKTNEAKAKSKARKNRNRGAADPDFEKMFGKDIDEFLEDSDWDIESFDNMSNFSNGTSRSALQDGRIRGLESIYLQRIETSMKRGGAIPTKKASKKAPNLAAKLRAPPVQHNLLQEAEEASALNDPSRSSYSRPYFKESANTTSNPANLLKAPDGISRQAPKPAVQTLYRQSDADPTRKLMQ